jgi:flagellar basal body-associated protein FliL
MSEDIQSADRRLRTVVIAVAIALALLAIVLYAYVLSGYLEYLGDLLNRQPQRGKNEVQQFIDIFVLLMVFGVAALAIYLALFGRKVLASGRFPPPRARVLVDTPIHTGAAAEHRGKIALFAAASIALLGLPGLLFLHTRLTDLLATLALP